MRVRLDGVLKCNREKPQVECIFLKSVHWMKLQWCPNENKSEIGPPSHHPPPKKKEGGTGTLLRSQDKQTKPQNWFFKLPKPTLPPRYTPAASPDFKDKIPLQCSTFTFICWEKPATGEKMPNVFHVLSKQTKSGTYIGNRKKCENSSGQMLPFNGVICCIIYLSLPLSVE